ncbi:MAG: hypothetical protein K2K92_10005 [Duncaniella sp.]|nr:hypothetical protein [Duncaniella sp.]
MIKDSAQYKTNQDAADKAIEQNRFIIRYVIAVDHALLWIAALCLAAFFHVSESFTRPEALLFSTLVAYGAYLCESGLETVKATGSLSEYELDFRKAGLWSWIALNVLVNIILSFMFLQHPEWYYLIGIIMTAGWQKYMDGRVGPRLQATGKKII